MAHRKPKHGEEVKRSRRALPSRWMFNLTVVALLIGCLVAVWMWPGNNPLLVISMLFLPVLLLALSPVVAFGTLAAVIFALGTYLRWPPVMVRLSPVRRGFAVLAVVVVAHGIWFQFGWVSFRPPCSTGDGPLSLGGRYALVGTMTPEAAKAFADTLNYRDREVAWLSGPNTVVARPAMALFDDGGVWNNTMKIATALAQEQGLPPPDLDRSDQCAELERIIMVGGKAESRANGWGTWPWNTFDERGLVVRGLRDVAR